MTDVLMGTAPRACGMCANTSGNEVHFVREMMFGTRESFTYLQCGGCGTLQLLDVPADLAPHYPPDYYSFDTKVDIDFTGWKRWLGAWAVANYYGRRRNVLGRYLAATREWAPRHFPPSIVDFNVDITTRSPILDIGCGGGELLLRLRQYGFRRLLGVDAFIDADVVHPNGVRILKRRIDEIDGQFALVMLHHSFEHLADPRWALERVRDLVDPGRYAIVRVPVVSWAWREYGVDWFQLDAPRHLFLFTERGFRDLAEASGFAVDHVAYDSTEFQFWVSEQYRRDIPLFDERSYFVNPEGGLFTRDQIVSWKRLADRLNAEGEGDQACYYLRRQ